MLDLLIHRSVTAMALCSAMLFFTCSTTPSSSTNAISRQSRPEWINNPYSKYDSQKYVAIIGSGKNDREARNNALLNFVKHYGQSIQVDQKISTIGNL
jgi:hypothetical protein